MSDDMYERGLEIRREIIGAERVDEEMEKMTEFQRPMFDLVTSYCFGAVWGRPAMDAKTRALITTAIAAGANREFAVRAHLRNSLRLGATKEEIQELIMHVAIYAGVPAAAAMTPIAMGIMEDLGIEVD